MPRALVVFAHPVPESLNAAAHSVIVDTLEAGGWEVDDCDLYAEKFDPVLTTEERRNYHNTEINTAPSAMPPPWSSPCPHCVMTASSECPH